MQNEKIEIPKINTIENQNIKLDEKKLKEFKEARQEQLNQDSLIRKMNIENILQETNIRGLK